MELQMGESHEEKVQDTRENVTGETGVQGRTAFLRVRNLS